jgi:hypothetical protein
MEQHFLWPRQILALQLAQLVLLGIHQLEYAILAILDVRHALMVQLIGVLPVKVFPELFII